MDAKITLSLDKDVIEKAKKYTESQNISLSPHLSALLLDFTLQKRKAGRALH